MTVKKELIQPSNIEIIYIFKYEKQHKTFLQKTSIRNMFSWIE